ncbi:beta-amyrin 28-oxidase [Phtheirospermum japonicum]|uniref:Beta-amyrin 28-oxidase n=1 Tax=Phtheirospermum japonicum TaxID=374723 RepID=A0A830BDL7_9LAMI|nr:beta-amyrin 28-oxidase [Phtheirospermum japonicum]
MAWYIIITALIALLLFVLFKTKTKSKGCLIKLSPGSDGWPILGEILEFIGAHKKGSLVKITKDRMEKYNTQVFKTSLMGESTALLCGPAGNKFLFSNENKLVAAWWPAPVKKLLGTCLATTAGVEGIQMRKMVSYFLSLDAFSKLYMKNIDVVCQQHINTYWQSKEELKVFPTIKVFAFEVACRSFMSIEEPSQIKRLEALFSVFTRGIFAFPLNFLGTEFYNAKKATAAIKKELGRIVRQRRKALEQKAALPSQDLLSHLLVNPDENGEFMSEPVIVNNILLLLFAGHDTSTCAITMMIKVLAEHPHVYETVLREQNEIASSKEAGESLRWEDIRKMRYSWNVVSETMRLWHLQQAASEKLWWI